MKNTVFTVMTVLLLTATLCLPAAAQKWQLNSFYSPAVDAGEVAGQMTYISDIAFRDDDLVCFGKGAHIFSLNLNTGSMWTVDHGGKENRVSYIAIPRRNGSVVIYGHGDRGTGRLEIRRTDNLSFIADAHIYDELADLSVDNNGNYVVGHTEGWNIDERYFTFDIWGHNGWQLKRNHMNERVTYASAIHPELGDGGPYRYFCFKDDPDLIREKAGRQWRWGDTYLTGSASYISVTDIAVGIFQGGTRIAGLLYNNRIDVWDWTGNRLFTFNNRNLYVLNSDILEFTPNGELLVTVSPSGSEVLFWDMSAREEHPFRFKTDASWITALAISDSGKRMAVGSFSGTVHIYDWTGGNAPAAPAQEVEHAYPTALMSNYPNPFNPETWIPYQLSEPAEVTVTIHASDGKLVRTLELGQMPAGAYSDKDRAAYWDGRNAAGEPVASGVYFYTLTAGDFEATRKMVIRK